MERATGVVEVPRPVGPHLVVIRTSTVAVDRAPRRRNACTARTPGHEPIDLPTHDPAAKLPSALERGREDAIDGAPEPAADVRARSWRSREGADVYPPLRLPVVALDSQPHDPRTTLTEPAGPLHKLTERPVHLTGGRHYSGARCHPLRNGHAVYHGLSIGSGGLVHAQEHGQPSDRHEPGVLPSCRYVGFRLPRRLRVRVVT